MSTSNNWLNPYQRSFNDIKAKLISELRLQIPEITDYSEGNIFVIIISIFAAIAEVIHYYIDNMAREAFLPTARRYSSLYKHAKLVDYHIKSAIPATVDVVLYKNDDTPIGQDITIPLNTEFTSSDGKTWISTKTVIWYKDSYYVTVPLVQQKSVGVPDRIQLGNILSPDSIIYITDIPSDQKYVEGSMNLYINDEPWILVDTFAYSSSRDKVYKVEIDEQTRLYIKFGDGQFGMKPEYNATIEASYSLTYGSAGNIATNNFTTVPQDIQVIDNKITINNVIPATGGSDYETFNMLKNHIPLSIKTLGVAITKEDFEAIAKMVGGVDKAYANYVCGRYVEIYITPDGGGEASSALLDSVEKTISKSKVITTSIEVLSTHKSQVFLDITITGKKSFKSNDILNQVKKALTTAYDYNNSDINKPIRLSDIYALVDNQSMVDYLTINKLYQLPYPIPQKNTSLPLNISYFVQNINPVTTGEEYIVMVNAFFANKPYDVLIQKFYGEGSDNRVLGSGSYGGVINVLDLETQTKIIFQITINKPSENLDYGANGKYKLTLLPMNQDLYPLSYQIPIIENQNITLSINEVV
jgi:uncharacterized phage protein gp47/JayE